MEIIPIIVGFLFTGIGVFFIYDTYNFRKTATQTQGKILGYESYISRSKNSGKTTMYTPVIEFKFKGEVYCFKSKISSSSMSYDIGQNVIVLYQENDLHNARLKTNLRYWMGGIFSILGLAALFFGTIYFQFNLFSLIISGLILISILFQIIKAKKRFNKEGVFSIKDLKQKYIEEKTNQQLDQRLNENYLPSEKLIKSQTQIKQAQQKPAWLKPLIILIGLGLTLGGSFWVKKRVDFFEIAQQTSGTIVDMESSYSDGTTTYAPVVNYTFPNSKQTVKFKHSVSSSHPSWNIGDKVKVLYNPEDQHQAMIDDGWWNWFGPGIVIILGVIFLLSGLFITKDQKKPRKKSRRLN